jgi:signal transduction histidine kinase
VLENTVAERALSFRVNSGSAETDAFDRMISALEKERFRIARDLHAGAGQPLAAIEINLELLRGTGLSPAADRIAVRIQKLADQALEQIRAVSHRLHPPSWQDLPAALAIAELVKSSGLGDRIETELHVETLIPEPSHACKVALYRCAQECISNVIRHSHAKRLRISLRKKGRSLELSVRDYGRGLTSGERGNGLGLIALREHASALNGCVRISGDSNGTTVVVSIPFDAE